jgi:hypothetical protein
VKVTCFDRANANTSYFSGAIYSPDFAFGCLVTNVAITDE